MEPSAKPRSLWPREHGAYVQLAAPLTAALVIAPSIAGVLLAGAAGAAFLAHEPLRVAIGRRGRRMRIEHGARARRRLLGCGAVAIAATAIALAIAPGLLGPVAAAAALGALAIVVAWRGHEHSPGGELVAAAALAGAAGPVAIAGDLPRASALALWLAWTLGFAGTVVAVHAVLADRRRAAGDRFAPFGFLAAIGIALVAGRWREPVMAAALPLWITAAATVMLRPPPASVRRVGIALALAAAASAAWAIRDGGARAGVAPSPRCGQAGWHCADRTSAAPSRAPT